MNWLKNTKMNAPPMTTETKTGTDVLRAALRARAHKGSYLSILARELNIGLGALDEWIREGKGGFQPEILDAMAKDIFGKNAGFDAERNLLVRKPPPSTPVVLMIPDLFAIRTIRRPKAKSGR